MRPVIILLILVLVVIGSVNAEVPQLINYQGRLTDDMGEQLDTTVSIVFIIYDDSTGLNRLWMETHPSVSVTGSLFDAMLGSYVPLNDSVFADTERWLGITVGTDPEIYPRTQLVTLPYACRVSTVDGATGGIISGDVNILAEGESPGDLAVAGKATIGPGHTNSGTLAFVAGENCQANGSHATIDGGQDNSATGDYSVVGGGLANSAEGYYSVILGGAGNTTTGSATASMAFGDGVYIDNALRVVFFDGITSGRLGLNRDHFDGGINHPIHVGTDGSNGNGAHLTAGGVWTNSSSRTFMDKFESFSGGVLLDKISAMPVHAWCYKGTHERHIGPIAEDFVAAFDVGTINEDGMRDNQYLSNSDIAGVALAGIKALLEKIEQLEARIAELEGK